MGLLTQWLLRRSGTRAIQLTNADNPGGIRNVTLTGTLALTKGSTAVVGTGTLFTTELAVDTVVQFASQPGVNYVVSAIASPTALTLLNAYGTTTTASTTAVAPVINYGTLAQAVGDAMAHFQAVTNFPFDDSTATTNPTPTSINKCIWAAISLVDYYLYEYRGQSGEDPQRQNSLSTAERRLKDILAVYGDGAFSVPVSDSVYNPSVGPTRLPDMDNARWSDVAPQAPGPGPSDVATGGGADGLGW